MRTKTFLKFTKTNEMLMIKFKNIYKKYKRKKIFKLKKKCKCLFTLIF